MKGQKAADKCWMLDQHNEHGSKAAKHPELVLNELAAGSKVRNV